MSKFKSITEFNKFLIVRKINVDYNQYFKLIHSRFYSEIDISFMDYFLSLIDHSNNFIIEDSKLLEYNAINNLDHDTILELINDNSLIENQDYIISNEDVNLDNKKKYILTPLAFKLCLMRTNNTDKYLKYYMLYDKCFHYYNNLISNIN
jgi:hypothetical protein